MRNHLSKVTIAILLSGGSSLCCAAQAQAPASPAAGTTGNLEEIVVTADKKTERLQDVASSISAVTGSQLLAQHLDSLSDYARTVPGLVIKNGGSPGQTTIVLRGIASTGTGALVGTYLDESPIGSSTTWNYSPAAALDLPPYEIQRLEVLRGPQGTLYGASTMGGLIKYVLTPASTTRFSLQAGADVAAVDSAGGVQASGRAAGNIPLIKDVLGIRISGFENHTPGYIDNSITGRKNVNTGDSYGGRVALEFTPTDTFTARANGFVFRSKYDDPSWLTYTGATTVPTSDGAAIATRGTPPHGLSEANYLPNTVEKSLDYVSLNLEWRPGPVKIVSASSFAHSDSRVNEDYTLIYGPYIPLFTGGAVPSGLAQFRTTSPLDKFVQEVRISAPDGDHAIDWMIGGFYTHEKSGLNEPVFAYDMSGQPIASLQPYFGSITVPTTYQEEAVFGNLTWRITERFDVSGGIRYSHNKQTFTENLSGPLFGSGSIPGGSHESVTTWMANARYHFTKDVMAYVRVATGYRPGGPNSVIPGSVGVPAQFHSDTLTNYEGGIKASFDGNRGFIDVSGFFIDWSKIQLGLIQNGFSYLANGGRAHSAGFEASTSYSPVQGFSIGGNIAYTDAKTLTAPAGSFLETGYQLPLIPKVAFTVLAAYDWRLGEDLKAHVGGNVHWTGAVWSNTVQQVSLYSTPSTRLPSYATLDFDASLVSGRLTYRAFIRNATNKHALQAVTYIAGLTQSNFSINQPRTIGVGFDVAF